MGPTCRESISFLHATSNADAFAPWRSEVEVWTPPEHTSSASTPPGSRTELRSLSKCRKNNDGGRIRKAFDCGPGAFFAVSRLSRNVRPSEFRGRGFPLSASQTAATGFPQSRSAFAGKRGAVAHCAASRVKSYLPSCWRHSHLTNR